MKKYLNNLGRKDFDGGITMRGIHLDDFRVPGRMIHEDFLSGQGA